MGANVSKTTKIAETINDIAVDVFMKNASNCANNTAVSQVINIGTVSPKNCSSFKIPTISQSSDSKINFQCIQDSSQQAKLMEDLTNQVNSKIDQVQSGLNLAAFSQTEQNDINRNITTIKENIGVSNLASCVANKTTSQEINIGDITPDCNGGTFEMDSIAQLATEQLVSSCLQSNSMIMESAKSLDTTVDTSNTTSSGFNPNSIIGIAGLVVMAPIIIGIIGTIILATFFPSTFKAIFGNKNSNN